MITVFPESTLASFAPVVRLARATGDQLRALCDLTMTTASYSGLSWNLTGCNCLHQGIVVLFHLVTIGLCEIRHRLV